MTDLVLDGVTVSRGVGPVISNISLTVPSGQVTAIVGPNGAGKTSLLEAISGIVRPSSGSIRLGDTDVTAMSRGRRARLGIVHVEQGRTIFPSLTVRENLELTATTTAQLEDVLTKFPELEKRLDSPAGLLSGGEQQMVVLGRAFAAHPKVLLIDEMSLGLAPVVFLRLVPIVAQVAAEGVGVLLVEQFANLALGIAADALVVASGKATFQGDAGELTRHPEQLRRAYLG